MIQSANVPQVTMFFIFSSWFSHLFFGIAYDFGFRGTEGLRFYSKIEGFTSEGPGRGYVPADCVPMKAASRLLQRVVPGRSGGDDIREIGSPGWARVRRESMQRDYETMKEIAVKNFMIPRTAVLSTRLARPRAVPPLPRAPAVPRPRVPVPPRPRFCAAALLHAA